MTSISTDESTDADQAQFVPDEVDAVDIATIPAGALTIEPDQEFWTLEQRAVLRAMGVDRDVTNAELAGFLHLCQRRGLDPFTRQVYLIGRKDKTRGGRKTFTPQTSIDGFRLIARRAADKAGIEYEYEDPLFIDQNGREHTVWIWTQAPAAVKFCVVRNGRRFPAVARLGAYMPTWPNGEPMNLWASMPDVMLAKCAEALALRMAFPEDLGGLYTHDEMEQDDAAAKPPAGATVLHGTVEPDAPQEPPAPAVRKTPARRPRQPSASVPAPAAPAAAQDGPPGPDDPVTDDRLRTVLAMLAECQVTTPEQGLMTLQLLTGKRLARSRQMTNAMAEDLIRTLEPIVASKTPHSDLQDLLRERFTLTMQQQEQNAA